MIELTFLKKSMLIKQANQRSVIFVTISVFEAKASNFNQMSAKDAVNLNDIAILNIKIADYCCIISTIIKTEAINLTLIRVGFLGLCFEVGEGKITCLSKTRQSLNSNLTCKYTHICNFKKIYILVPKLS